MTNEELKAALLSGCPVSTKERFINVYQVSCTVILTMKYIS